MKYFIVPYFLVAAINCFNQHQQLNYKDFIVAGNTDTIPENENKKNETLAGRWQLQPVLASDTSSGKIPVLNFNLKTGQVSGNTGCNTFSGSFILKNNYLSFDKNILSTRFACQGYNEQVFLDNLLKINRYEIKQGVLQLMYNSTILSNWSRHADTATTKEL